MRLKRRQRKKLWKVLVVISIIIVIALLAVEVTGVYHYMQYRNDKNIIDISTALQSEEIVSTKDISQSIIQNVTEAVAGDTTESIPETVAGNTVQNTTEAAAGNTTQGIAESTSEGSTGDMNNNIEQNQNTNLVIELDPGHGGSNRGAISTSSAEGTKEKDINLKIAKYLKQELETYANVTIYLTRDTDKDVELEDRVAKAVQDKADVIISLHNNAKGDVAQYNNGCTVLTARGVYQQELSNKGQELGCYILNSLTQLGIQNQGLMFRVCQNKETYPNGELRDYYGIIKNATLQGIVGILIEHAFIDNQEDYTKFLSSDDKLEALAKADAKGIASYYKLQKKTGSMDLDVLTNHEEKITVITSDNYAENKEDKKTYFAQ